MLENISKVNPENIKLMNKYKVDMSVRDVAENTQYRYLQDLKQFFIWIIYNADNKSVLEIDDDNITDFLYFCKSEGNNSARIKFRVSVISSFYRFLRKKKLLSTNPTEFIDRPKRCVPVMTQTYLSTEQIALMREKLIEHGDLQLRLYAMLSLSTMARANAIASLRWDQIDIQNYVIHNVLEKESKIVDLYFNEEVKCLLINLKGERELKHISDNGWLFYTHKCTPEKHITTGTLNAWCKKIGNMIGVPTLHTHDWRHSYATILARSGMPLEDISVLLNHESVDTTRKFYIKQDVERINNSKRKMNL